MRSRLSLALSAGLLLLATGPAAEAAMMRHYDLTSLGVMADAVVLADRGTVRTVEPYVTATTYRIVRVYGGSLRPGATVEAYDGTYALDREPGGFSRAERPFDRRVVAFLVHDPQPRPGGVAYSLVPSGLRLLRDGKVYRFEQWSNPGPYVPVPQGHDPQDVRDGATRDAPIALAVFERELAAALRRAAEVRAALAAPAGPGHRARLLRLLGPVQDHLVDDRPSGFYTDDVALRVVQSLAGAGDVDGALEALARTVGLRPWPLRGDAVTTEALLARGANAALARHVRVEALLSVWDPDGPRVESVQSLGRLLTDGELDVRSAAAKMLGRVGGYSYGGADGQARAARTRTLARAAVRDAYRTETNGAVRVALINAADALGLGAGLRPPRGATRWAIAARRLPGGLVVELAQPGGNAPRIEAVGIEPAGCTLEDGAAWNQGRAFRLQCPAGAPPPARATVDATLPNGTTLHLTLPLP